MTGVHDRRPHSLALEKRIATLEQQARSAAEQLVKQAAEYERRLESLNESRTFEREAIALMVPRGEYDQLNAEFREWRRSVDARLAQNQGAKAMLWAVGAIVMAMVTTAISLISIGVVVVSR